MNFEKEVSIGERVNYIKYTISILLTTYLRYLKKSTNSFSFQFFWMVENSQMMQEMYKKTAFRIASKVLGKLYVLFFLPHCFMPFALLKHVYYLPGNHIPIKTNHTNIFIYSILKFCITCIWRLIIHNVNIFISILKVLWSTRAMILLCFGTWPIWKKPVKMLLKPVKTIKEAKKENWEERMFIWKQFSLPIIFCFYAVYLSLQRFYILRNSHFVIIPT